MSPRDLVVRAEWSARLADTANRLNDLASAAAEWRIAAQLYAEAAAAAAEGAAGGGASLIVRASERERTRRVSLKLFSFRE